MDNMFPSDYQPSRSLPRTMPIIQTVTMAVTLFLEIWMLLPPVPQLDAAQRLEWTKSMITEARKHGAPFPAPNAADASQAR